MPVCAYVLCFCVLLLCISVYSDLHVIMSLYCVIYIKFAWASLLEEELDDLVLDEKLDDLVEQHNLGF